MLLEGSKARGDGREGDRGSKVYALNMSPSSVLLGLDASLIMAVFATQTKDRIALNYICWTLHSR